MFDKFTMVEFLTFLLSVTSVIGICFFYAFCGLVLDICIPVLTFGTSDLCNTFRQQPQLMCVNGCKDPAWLSSAKLLLMLNHDRILPQNATLQLKSA